jgi:hypothetical protein
MLSALVRAYRVALWFYPGAFRRRYADEMRLDFKDAVHDAVAAGAVTTLLFACRQTTDLCSSLLREWSRDTRAATAVATTVITAVLWGLALRPWAWKPSVQPRDRQTFATAPVDVWELFLVAIVAMVPGILLIVLAPRLTAREPTFPNQQSPRPFRERVPDTLRQQRRVRVRHVRRDGDDDAAGAFRRQRHHHAAGELTVDAARMGRQRKAYEI